MIRDFSVRPRPTNNRAKWVTLACLFGAAAFTVLYFAMKNYKGVIGLVALGFITAAIFLYIKYLAPTYNYEILTTDTSALFVVSQTIGKKTTALCRIDLASIVKVEREGERERREHKTEAGYTRYVYCPTMGPETTYLITSRTRYERAEIRIEASDEFARLLTEYSIEARQLAAAREDEDEF